MKIPEIQSHTYSPPRANGSLKLVTTIGRSVVALRLPECRQEQNQNKMSKFNAHQYSIPYSGWNSDEQRQTLTSECVLVGEGGCGSRSRGLHTLQHHNLGGCKGTMKGRTYITIILRLRIHRCAGTRSWLPEWNEHQQDNGSDPVPDNQHHNTHNTHTIPWLSPPNEF